jgi:hypothetical protein
MSPKLKEKKEKTEEFSEENFNFVHIKNINSIIYTLFALKTFRDIPREILSVILFDMIINRTFPEVRPSSKIFDSHGSEYVIIVFGDKGG